MNIIFAGALGRFPIGGHAWTEMHYLLGLEALGHNVYFLEDCGDESWVYNWQSAEITHHLDYPVKYIESCLQPAGFGEKWIYRVGDQSCGMNTESFREICANADLLLIRSLSMPRWREEYNWPRRRVFLDTDPGFIQIRIENGDTDLGNTVSRCERLFSIGHGIGEKNNIIPTLGRNWHKTIFPVIPDLWRLPCHSHGKYFTSVMQWKSYQNVCYRGISYGNKEMSFPEYRDLPELTPQPLQLAYTGDENARASLHEAGWKTVCGWYSTFLPEQYREYIQQSRAEIGIAKQGYTRLKTGWFSDRSVCYLAAGRPTVVQDTGQQSWLNTGCGVLLFENKYQAADAINAINSDYEAHSQAARHLAENVFNAGIVLPALLETAMN